VATKYFARKPINHKGTHYRPGDEITGFTGWWRYWQYLRYARVNQVDTVSAPTLDSLTPGNGTLEAAFTAVEVGGDPFIDVEYNLDGGAWNSSGGTSSPFVIGTLDNGTAYAVRVRAVNSAGAGIYRLYGWCHGWLGHHQLQVPGQLGSVDGILPR
jgi:hypothetical protein